MGLEASKRGLFTQQSALYTTGHNISNANTEGYSRQRVNMEPTLGYPGIGLNQPKTAGFIGTGVQAHSVQRIRDEFTDRQYRQETNKLGYWESRTDSISQMEDIMAEPSEYGINASFNEFWKSIEDVSKDPDDSAARKVMVAKAQQLSESFNYMDTQLRQIQGNIGNEIQVSTTDINSILKQIAEINKQIQAVEPNGYMPNDLYDARDVLVDQLNEYIPVSIERKASGGNALDIAEGSYTVTFKPVNGGAVITLVDGKEYATLTTLDSTNKELDGGEDDATTGKYTPFGKIEVKEPVITNPPTVPITYTNKDIVYADLDPAKGKLLSLIDAYGHGADEGVYPEMLTNLDTLANSFMKAFNDLQKTGHSLDGPGLDFFTGNSAKSMSVKQDFIDKPSLIAASDVANEPGNNNNALKLATLQSEAQTTTLNGATFQSYYESIVGKLGVEGEQAITLSKTSETLKLAVENNRASMSSVSLDEEMTNMITFQQAYNANARMITVVDETLDKIINGMGRVGL